MANKIKLGNRPKTFAPCTIKFKMPDGTDGAMRVTYTYFTKTESGRLFDEMAAAAKAKDAEQSTAAEQALEATDSEQTKPPADEKPFSLESLMEKLRDQNAEYILRVLSAWELDEDISADNLRQLDDEVPAASIALMEGFRIAAQTGRLGN